MWLNEASRALAEAGASVADVVAFRRTALIEGTAALLAVILTWMLVD